MPRDQGLVASASTMLVLTPKHDAARYAWQGVRCCIACPSSIGGADLPGPPRAPRTDPELDDCIDSRRPRCPALGLGERG